MLTDPFGRRIDYLRVSVTDRCDLRCVYCLSKGFKGFTDSARRLSAARIERIVRAFVRLGVRKVRITGGEPLVRPDILEIAQRLGAIPGINDLALSTNGSRLAALASPLREAGIGRLNLSLDTLRPERFAAITGGGDLAAVLAGLNAARAAGMAPIKINTVALAGVNDDELFAFVAFVAFCADRGLTLRLIEVMPLGATGREASRHFLNASEIERRLREHYPLVEDGAPASGPARYLRVAGSDLCIGLITPMSQHFCGTCNRLRLTSDGVLHPCLGDLGTVDLCDALGARDDGPLETAIKRAVALKPERHGFDGSAAQPIRFMAHTGG